MRNSISSLVTVIAPMVIFGTIGILGTFFPKQVQSYVLKYYEENTKFKSIKPYLGFVETNGYLVMLRVSGVVGLVAFVFIVFVLVIKVIYNM